MRRYVSLSALIISFLFASPVHAQWRVEVLVTGVIDANSEGGGRTVPAALQVGEAYTLIVEYFPLQTVTTFEGGNEFLALMDPVGMNVTLTAGTDTWRILGGTELNYRVEHYVNPGTTSLRDEYRLTAASMVADPVNFPGSFGDFNRILVRAVAPVSAVDALWVDRDGPVTGHIEAAGALDLDATTESVSILAQDTVNGGAWEAVDQDATMQVTVQFEPVRLEDSSWGRVKSLY